jgi:hypothetical protein
MKENWSETLWNEEIRRRCEAVENNEVMKRSEEDVRRLIHCLTLP